MAKMKRSKKNNEQEKEQPEVKAPSQVPAELDAMVKGRLRLFEKTATRKQRKWLTAYALTGQLVKAQELSGVDWRSHYYWKKTDQAYSALFDEAREIALDLAESEVFRRGIAGYEKYLSYKGKRCDKVTEYSDNLAMFYLKGYRSHFRDGIGGAPIGPTQINLLVSTAPVQPAAIEVNSRPALPVATEPDNGADDEGDLPPAA